MISAWPIGQIAVRSRSAATIDDLIGTGSYRDTGCPDAISGRRVEIRYPSCLTCPLPECQFEVPFWRQRVAAGDERDRRIIDILNKGRDSNGHELNAEAVAMRIGCSARTIQRVVARARREQEQTETVQ